MNDNELSANTVRRSSRQTKLPSSLNDFIIEGKVKYGVERVVNYANLSLANYCFISALNKSIEPTCYEEVVLDSNWIDVMNAEIEALNENQTWVIVDLPTNRKAIGNKWIYKIKYKSSGDIDRYKARLVVKGFNQKEGIDFDENFSLVVKMSTVRCIIALSVTSNWPLFQLDVNNAFLYGDLDKDIYMTIPKGCKPVSTPMVPNYVLPYEPTEDDPLLDNITGYQKLLGKLINITHIRPDIAYPVHCLAQYMHSPLKSHLSCALNVLRYLKGAPGKGIRYKYPNIKDTICGYHDADWAKCLKTRKSVTGYCVFFNNCLIS
ncbi:ribonuclease H-like domain-containing protein [Tanacetum coccineum]|uniref:Ribonuclease H-like domain-containing protein n=1 Tax=Tanacetum coccineum TaxID=301880 RepID=A0ABQ5GIB5_9ASTR